MKKSRALAIFLLLIVVGLLGVGTMAYFRIGVNGNLTGNTANLVLTVNEANAVDSESFNIVLQRSETENFIMPDDSGVFDININANSSDSDLTAIITISRISLPENLKFYSDENHTQEITTYKTVIKKSNDMTKSVPIYWFWDGSIDDANDMEFINKSISAGISVTATLYKSTFYDTLLSMDYTLDTTIDFSKGPSETNGEGLMMLNTTQDDEYPVVYYRGDVANNNVIFADFCWLIVRTTETGGVKLLYNGEVNSDGSCNNYSNATATKVYDSNVFNAYLYKETFVYNSKFDSPVYVGYMYNDTNKYFTHSEGWIEEKVWPEWGSDHNGVLDSTGYLAHLSNNTIDSVTGYHVQNKYDSNAKSIIDSWYKSYIYGKIEENLLEDTVWCNERSVTSETFTIENYATNRDFYFALYTKIEENKYMAGGVVPSLVCSRDMDKFTVSSENGNGDLTYPIGMLTGDETVMAGTGASFWDNTPVPTTYLSIPYVNDYENYSNYWLLSPYWFSSGKAGSMAVSGGRSDYWWVDHFDQISGVGIRAAISLKNDTYIIGGNGTFEKPYIVR